MPSVRVHRRKRDVKNVWKMSFVRRDVYGIDNALRPDIESSASVPSDDDERPRDVHARRVRAPGYDQRSYHFQSFIRKGKYVRKAEIQTMGWNSV